jgi:hypothetical protein
MKQWMTVAMFGLVGCWTGTGSVSPVSPATPAQTTTPIAAPDEGFVEAMPVSNDEPAPHASMQPTVASAPEAAPVDAPPVNAAPAPQAKKGLFEGTRGKYIGAGAAWVPIDGGATGLSATGGLTIASEQLEVRLGARIAFGDTKYSTMIAGIGEIHTVRWLGPTFGVSAGVGAGTLYASRKNENNTSAWDGLLGSLFLVASPVRLRFGRIETSLDVGFLYAIQKDYPAPFGLLSVTGRL